MATPPPKIGEGQGKPIPVGDLGQFIDKKEPPPSATKLRDHEPTAPLEKKSGKAGSKTKPDMTFPPEVITRSDAKLSKAERAERAKVANPSDGVGFGFGKDKPTKEAVKRWYDGLSAEDKAALKDPSTMVYITATCSKPGKPGFNQGLSDRRAENTARILEKDYGVDRSRISPLGLGEINDPFDGESDDNKDNHKLRVARIGIHPGTIEPSGETRKTQEPTGDTQRAKDAGGKTGDQGKPPEPPEKYTPEQGMKDSVKDVLVNLISDSIGAAKTVADYAIQFITAVGEAHDKNKQQATARGVQYSLSILSRDDKTENAHVKDGKPYTVDGMVKRVRETYQKEIDFEMPYLKTENSEGSKQLRQGISVTVQNLNRVLAKARTPEHRRTVIETFVKEGQKRISQAYRKRDKE
ncbi:MAG: OmpA family protein [Anaerolineales bacterium]